MPALLLPLLLLLLLGALSSCGEAGSPLPGGFTGPGTAERIPLPDLRPPEPYGVLEEKGIPILLPDGGEGTRLYADVYRPAAEGRFPTLIYATAYRRDLFGFVAPPTLVSDGYATVFLDVLGSGSSEGGWEALSDREIDGITWVIDHWIPAQPWSNGKVGMYGQSYMAITAYLTAGRKPRHLKAVLPVMAMADAYRDVFFQGGILDQQFMFFWARFTIDLSLLPPTQLLFPRPDHFLEDVASGRKALDQHRAQEPVILSWIEQTTDGPFYDERSTMSYWADLAEVPILAAAGWWGIFTRGSLLNHTEVVKQGRRLARLGLPVGSKRIIVGPWYHVNGAFLEGLPGDLLHRRWFDWHLKADDQADYRRYDILDPAAPVILYVLGREQWRREKEWPLSRARYASLYLSGETQVHDRNPSLNNGSLSWEPPRTPPEAGAAAPAATRILHEPCAGEPLLAGEKSRSNCRWLAGLGDCAYAEDERENERRVLTFSTPPLEQDLEMTGPAVLRLWARSRFGAPCDEPPAFWFEQAEENGVDLSALLPWARQPDVQWTVNVNDVFPDGRVRNLTSGWLAASHRPDPDRPDWTQPGYDPFDYPEDRHPVPPEPDRAIEYVVEIWPVSNVFRAGHQIRIDIAVSDFPHFLPSLVPSENEILHDAGHPSRLVLPLVDEASTDPAQWIDDPAAFFAGEPGTWTADAGTAGTQPSAWRDRQR